MNAAECLYETVVEECCFQQQEPLSHKTAAAEFRQEILNHATKMFHLALSTHGSANNGLDYHLNYLLGAEKETNRAALSLVGISEKLASILKKVRK